MKNESEDLYMTKILMVHYDSDLDNTDAVLQGCAT